MVDNYQVQMLDLGIIEKLAKAIVRPPRAEYKPNELVPPCFELKHRVYEHHSFEVVNNRGLKLRGSYVRDRYSATARQTIIFLHANGSCRLVMKNYLQIFLPLYDLVSFDFAGCGMSQGEYITLGYNQREDVYAVVNHIRQQFGVKTIYLWGRSMGAATAILYTAKYGGIKAIISDNSYCDLDILINELSDDYLPFLPTFLLDGIINSIQEYIEEILWKKENTDFNMRKLKPIKVIDKIACPIIFIGSTEDTFVNVKHTKDLYAKTKSTKWLQLVKGNHNDARTSELKVKIVKYLQQIKNKPVIKRGISKNNLNMLMNLKPKSPPKKDINSPLEVKLVNCAEEQYKKVRSPILSKTEEKIQMKDKKEERNLSSIETDRSEKKAVRESYFERRMKIEEMSKRMRTHSKIKRKKIFEGIDFINEHLNGQEG